MIMVEHAGLELIIQVDANLKFINKIINFAAVGLGNMHCKELMLIPFLWIMHSGLISITS